MSPYRRGGFDRDRGREEIVEEVIVEEGPYYEEEVITRGGTYREEYAERTRTSSLASAIFSIIGIIIIGAVLYSVCSPNKRTPPAEMAAKQKEDLRPVPIGEPLIDLQAVEEVLWKTKVENKDDFKKWMEKFEDEVNAIYFATLRRKNPNADPATLMKKPIRVDPRVINKLLYIYGYIDENGKPGYQNGEDKLIFVFEQTKPYDPNKKEFAYALRDGNGYYYREPGYVYKLAAAAIGTVLIGAILYKLMSSPPQNYGWWRPQFSWWGSSFWNDPRFSSRYQYYYQSYPRYYRVYRKTYYVRYRPWGWKRGVYFKRGAKGKYYYRYGTGYKRSYGTGYKRSYGTGYKKRSFRFRWRRRR